MKRTLMLVGLLLGTAVLGLPLIKPAKESTPSSPSFVNKKVDRIATLGNLSVRLKGIKEQYLKVYNSPKLNSQEEMDSYISERQSKLAEMAESNPERQIEVAVSPARKLSLVDFGDICKRNDLAIEELSLDIFVDGKWERMVWFDKTTALLDITQDAQTLTRRILEIESSRPAAPMDSASDKPTSDPAPPLPVQQATVSLRFARGLIKTASALRLQQDKVLLLVDPVTDLQDAFKDEAKEVRVKQMPHLYVDRELKFGRLYAAENQYKYDRPSKARN
jgi:hypothetical protein